MTIALTETPRNLPHLADSVSYFLRKGARNVAVAPSISSDADWELDRVAELDAQFARILERSLSHYRRTGEIPVGIFRGGRKAAARARRARPMCGIGRLRSIAVDVDGGIYGCALFAKVLAKSSRLTDDEFKNLVGSTRSELKGKIQALRETPKGAKKVGENQFEWDVNPNANQSPPPILDANGNPLSTSGNINLNRPARSQTARDAASTRRHVRQLQN